MSRTSDDSDRSPRQVRVRCPAKINLHLRVGPARSDGFHPLLTWMCTIGLFDMLEMRLADDAAGTSPPIRLTCVPPTLPSDERNLVVKIVNGWAKERDPALPTIDATLTKHVPMGAGLGGGSGDAAGALLGARRLWDAASEPVPAEDLSAFAGRFGSDIPFFFHAPSAICSGRGEVVRPVAAPARAQWAVLILPPIVMPTPEVYRGFDALGLGRAQDLQEEPDWRDWAGLSAAELMSRLVNDLERPAFDLRPELDELRRRAEKIIDQPVRMSGSGSSLFTLFDKADQAGGADANLKRFLAPTENIGFAVVEVAPQVNVEAVG